MPSCATEQSNDLMSRVDDLLRDSGLLQNHYFTSLRGGDMSREEFCRSQRQFYHAVNYFSRPMSGLLMRTSCPKRRLGILANVVEEHGDFQPPAFHEATFRAFLQALSTDASPEKCDMAAPVDAFNATIMSACVTEEIEVGIACLGIIEYAFADISALIGQAVVERGWVRQENLVHYSLHAEIDKQHAADFFVLLEDAWKIPAKRAAAERGLRLGAYSFDRLYRDM